MTTVAQLIRNISFLFIFCLFPPEADAGIELPKAIGSCAPRLFVVSIGINAYSNASVGSLQLAEGDASRIAEAFYSATRPHSEFCANTSKQIDPILLLGAAATKIKVIETLKNVSKLLVDKDDVMIIYFAGISTNDLVANDVNLFAYDSTNVSSTMLSIGRDIAVLATGGKRIVLIADGCNIGNGMLGSTWLTEPTFAILGASKQDEFAVEAPQWNGSPLANELVGALSAYIPDLDRNGLISLEALYIYLYPRVLQDTKLASMVGQHIMLSGSMTHRIYILTAKEPIPQASITEHGEKDSTFKIIGGELAQSVGTFDININGHEGIPVNLERGGIIRFLGEHGDQSLFRQGLNQIAYLKNSYLYWREGRELIGYDKPYKNSYAIIVAIDDYDRLGDFKNRGRTGFSALEGMVDRAKDLKLELTKFGFREEKIIELYDRDATSDRLVDELKKFWQGNERESADRVFFYFGGHGREYNGDVLLVTYDFDPSKPSLTSVDARQIVDEHSRNIMARHMMIALDVCHAGLAVYNGLGEIADVTSDRRFQELSIIRSDTEGKARNILVAGTQNEDAFAPNGGLFTSALIRGLRGGADYNRTGVIEFDQLASYVRDQVVSTAARIGLHQTPTGRVLDVFGEGRFLFIKE